MIKLIPFWLNVEKTASNISTMFKQMKIHVDHLTIYLAEKNSDYKLSQSRNSLAAKSLES